MENRWFSVKEIATYLGVKKDTIYKWINRKNMPTYKVGKLWKFRKEEVDEWIRSGGSADKRKTSDKKKEKENGKTKNC